MLLDHFDERFIADKCRSKCDSCELNVKQNRVLEDRDLTKEALVVDEVVVSLKQLRCQIGQADLVLFLRGSKSQQTNALIERTQDLPHHGSMKGASIANVELIIRNMVLSMFLGEVRFHCIPAALCWGGLMLSSFFRTMYPLRVPSFWSHPQRCVRRFAVAGAISILFGLFFPSSFLSISFLLVRIGEQDQPGGIFYLLHYSGHSCL